VDSFIGDEGAAVVTEALRNNYTVRSLDMRGCNIRADGAGALPPRAPCTRDASVASFSSPPTLRGLLSLTPFLAALLALPVALAELVENNVHLQSLGLEWNSIGMSESGLQRLCQVKACQIARLCFRRVRAPLLPTSRSGGGGKERGARGDRPGLF